MDMPAAVRVVARRNMTGSPGRSSKDTDSHPERANDEIHVRKSIACACLLESEFEKPLSLAVAAWAAMWQCRLYLFNPPRQAWPQSHNGQGRMGRKICFGRMQKVGNIQK